MVIFFERWGVVRCLVVVAAVVHGCVVVGLIVRPWFRGVLVCCFVAVLVCCLVSCVCVILCVGQV